MSETFFSSNKIIYYLHFFYIECAEKLFDLVDGFAESTKRKAAVWPLQIILLILCPEIIQDISRDVVDENNMNKVRRAKLYPYVQM